MRTISGGSIAVLCLLAFPLLLGACGSKSPDAATSQESADGSGKLDPCTLLTEAQVRAIVPDLEGSFVAHAGASLLEGVEAYQCSYANKSAQGLTVILNVAADVPRFEQIKRSSDFYSAGKPLEIGDAAWVYGEHSNKVTVYKHLTVIDLNLDTADAAQRTESLIELARQVAAKVP